MKPQTALDLLNKWCQPEQKLKGGNQLDEKWVSYEIAQRELDRAKTAYRVKNDRLNELYANVQAYHEWLTLAVAHGETQVIQAVYDICLQKFEALFGESPVPNKSVKDE